VLDPIHAVADVSRRARRRDHPRHGCARGVRIELERRWLGLFDFGEIAQGSFSPVVETFLGQ